MFCGKCCQDTDLPILALIFPATYLDAAGQEFYRAHGLDKLFLSVAPDLKFEWQGKVFTINALGLVLPHVYLDAVGQAFYREHELDRLLKNNDIVRVHHRCQHLTDDMSCDIYDLRPQLCRDYDCSKRDECTQVHPLEFRR